jgi:PKD domain-containing protein
VGGLVRPLLVLVCVCALPVFASASASAATFCVHSPAGCVGTTESTVANAITAAASSPGRDQIQIAGSHTYDENDLSVANGNPVDIVGVGSPRPVITRSTTGPLLEVDDTTSTVSNLGLSLPAGATSDTGLEMAGTAATGINVTAAGSASDSSGIDLVGNGTTLTNASVVLPFSPTSNSTVAIELDGDNESVRDSTFTASTSAFISGSSGARLSRDTFTGSEGVEDSAGGNAVLENSLIFVSGSNGANNDGLVVSSTTLSETDLVARNLTIIDAGNHGSAGARGAEAVISDPGDGDAVLLLLDSIVRGFTTVDLHTDGSGAIINEDYNDWGTSTSVNGGGAVGRGTHDLNVDPGFVNAAGGDFHLTPGSPLIDAGLPATSLLAGESPTDVFGAPREAAGRTPCAFIRDIGASEFQAGLLTARVSGPASGRTGRPLTFSSSGSCGPSAQVGIASFAWTLSDGASASGPVVSHAFSRPGTQAAKLIVTDTLGHSASATVTVPVVARRASLRRLKLSPSRFRAGKGTRITFRLNEAATVRFTVKQKRAHSKKLRTLRGSFTVRGKSGSNRFRFSGRLRHKKLKPGRYVLVATPGTGAFKGKAVSAHFRIVR